MSRRIRAVYFESCNCDAICPCRRIDGVPGGRSTHGVCRRASVEQRAALEKIFTGRLGGDAERHFPWAWKASALVAVGPVDFEVDHTRHRQRLRIRDHVSVRIRSRHEGGETVTASRAARSAHLHLRRHSGPRVAGRRHGERGHAVGHSRDADRQDDQHAGNRPRRDGAPGQQLLDRDQQRD
jgi:hypothetical protein